MNRKLSVVIKNTRDLSDVGRRVCFVYWFIMALKCLLYVLLSIQVFCNCCCQFFIIELLFDFIFELNFLFIS